MTAIEYHFELGEVQAGDLRGFFEGWPNPPQPETHLALLQRSDEIVLAVESSTKRIVGFVNVLSDRVLTAYIPLIEVLPEFRGRGIGAELIRLALERVSDIYMVDVTCDPDVQAFYESLGFTKSTGACVRRYEHQSGAPDC
ncbi:MAG: GNAT family N-acetyltransferase [Planctomycetota bacterium]|nr:GNAT family N-acetyltransferase [Planctomycetota bacterium]